MRRTLALALLLVCCLPALARAQFCCTPTACVPSAGGCTGVAVTDCGGCVVGACCTTVQCTMVTGPHCPGGSAVFVSGMTCAAAGCPPLGICCAASGACSISAPGACVGTFDGSTTSCAVDACGPAGACCLGSGVCSIMPEGTCTGAWISTAQTCLGMVCTTVTGGCCDATTGLCAQAPALSCAGLGHRFLGAGQACGVAACPAPLGACCTRSSCTATSKAACANEWKGAQIVCAPNPCCPADFAGGNGVELGDIFAFLTAWFAGCP